MTSTRVNSLGSHKGKNIRDLIIKRSQEPSGYTYEEKSSIKFLSKV
jgi:hypothetical protein